MVDIEREGSGLQWSDALRLKTLLQDRRNKVAAGILILAFIIFAAVLVLRVYPF